MGTGVVLDGRVVTEVDGRADAGYGNPRLSSEQTPLLRTDVAVVGAGAAGLYAALVAAREGARVVLVSRSPLAETASYWAQGGIAAALAVYDSPERHLADTLAAGRGACRISAARVLCEESPESVRDLESLGVRFDADRHGALALGLEGGHSVRRVVHAGGSATGRRITRELSARVATDERVEVLESATARSLLRGDGRCVGLRAERPSGRAVDVLAGATVLATGGAAALWQRTTNPPGAVGAGMTLAAHAGAELADLEFVQFHPTALVSATHDGFLITEAIRGEGALLIDDTGERFVDELAPRDQVALAIQHVLASEAGSRVLLDLRAIDMTHFPNVAAALHRAGFDPARDPVPVAPAAHYTMGGIATDAEGRSSVPGLLAVGECACNGLHGANRLASNSLAECFVFGRRAALAATATAGPVPEADRVSAPSAGPDPIPPPATREALWRDAGLERTAEGLSALLDDPFPLARAIAAAALAREESRGAHQRKDRPAADPALDGRHVTITGTDVPRLAVWS
ncbi:MAG: L-aspartate oxidase [Thermoleophilaceae bacterium]|nr:L-aspartate oxidase [Thermoleophilaceae bacterium]